MSSAHLITQEGLDRFKVQLNKLKEEDRPAVIEEISEARSHGDLRENFQYASAKSKQELIESKIAELEALISTSEVFNPETVDDKKHIRFGAKVTLKNTVKDEVKKYQIVSENEADLELGLLAITAPIAKAIIDKTEGEKVPVTIAGKETIFEIEKVSY